MHAWNMVDPEDRQLNILTLIDKLPQEEKGARFFYEMFSDYVHLASHVLVIDNPYGKRNQTPRSVKSSSGTLSIITSKPKL